MELKKAQVIASKVIAELSPHCSRIEVAGSIRRRRPEVHDIDLVLIPANQGQFLRALQSLGKLVMGGSKLLRCQMPETVLDIYIATPETWATLLLIRTGSKRHNIMLCTAAKDRGMKLHADGSGLFRIVMAERIAGDTERSIFEALGIPYREPEERE